MKILIKNIGYASFNNDIRALVSSFYPGAELVFEEYSGENQTDDAAASNKSSGGISGINMNNKGRTAEAVPVLSYNEIIDIDLIAEGHKENPLRFEEKTELKKLIYNELSDKTGKHLPWGTLTGIRPVRIREMLEAGDKSQDEIDRELKERFLISDTKIALMNDIADREKSLLESIDYRNGCSIYIGIPFCPTRCLYCSFTSNQVGENDERPDRYVDCVCRELDALCEGRKDRDGVRFEKDKLKTLYIGGGTPTALNERQLEKLLDKVEDLFGVPYEYTVEAGRPDSITKEKLELLKAHGVGRISINPQTFNQHTLDIIGRRHTVEQTVWAYELARDLGFDNINMDIIVGLPGEGIREVMHTLDVIRELEPESLTVHALAVKRASRLSTEGKAWGGIDRKGMTPDSSEAEEIRRMTELGAECAESMHMHPYYLYRQKNMAGNQDNVGYAREGTECLYNILMMEEKHSVYGIGAGASTKLVLPEKLDKNTKMIQNRIKRYDNIKNLNDYLIYSF